MYKVLIADDESSVVESLKRSVPWEELGYEVAACASNGREALEAVEKENIQVAILDIRMPGMSGLEVCAKLREKRENIQLIIISGFAEFSYAERAMEFGVLGYCLKPIETEKMKKLLLRAAAILKKQEGKNEQTKLIDVLDSENLEEAASVLKRYGMNPEAFYLTVYVGDARLSIGKNGIELLIGRGLRAYLSREPVSVEQYEEFLKQGGMGIGYEEQPISVFQLQDMIMQCKIRAYQFFVTEERMVCKEIDISDAAGILSEISTELTKMNRELIRKRLHRIANESQRKFDITTCMRLNNMIYASALFEETDTDYYIYEFHQMLTEYGTFSMMMEKLEAAVGGDEVSNMSDQYSNSAFMKLLTWIEKNYKNDISLTNAADQMHMNPNYLSRMFKKEAGITFVHYITQLRMNEAIRLLNTTSRSVSDISLEVGFNDYFYFLKSFKKYTGKTPSQYRDE